MKTFIITINIDNEQIETIFIDAPNLKTAQDQYKGDWDYDVIQVHESYLTKHPKLIMEK